MLHTRKFPHQGQGILHGDVELCTKQGRNLQPRNKNAFALCKDASFHLTEGLL